jgi:hypothetical protein
VLDDGRVRFPLRDYLLYASDRHGWKALGPFERPNLWWPEDHAWTVAREIDFVATYVGGPSDAITALRNDATLAAVTISPTEPFRKGREYRTSSD